MKILLLAIFLLSSLTSISQVWINEIHYDNTGTDTGEGVEIAGIAGTDLSCYDIIPYNGTGGVTYAPIGNPSGVLPNSNCGFGAVFIPISGLQNGAPDGFALVNTCTSVVIQFLSYEGVITATNGPANGMTSEDIGVSQNGAPSGTSIQLAGIGNQYTDFTWETDITSTYNGMNTNQNFCVSTNTITTVAVATSPFVVTCNTAATGNVEFTSTGTFNLANVYTAQLSNELGDFTIPTNIGTLASTALLGTIPFSIPAGTVAGSLYRIRVISNDPLTIGTDNGINLTVTNNCTITTGTVSSSSFTVSCAAGTNGSINFTSSSTMLAGNVYSAQLSDPAGSFIASTTIGTLSSTADNGTISFTIPATTATGSNYLIRVIASNPSTTGTTSAALTITLTDGPCAQEPPHLTSVIINSCDPTCDEGFNEIVFGTSGDYSFDVNTTNFDFFYGSTNPGTNYTDVLVNNAVGIDQLNTAAGCPGTFIDAVGTTIPPNSSWVLVYRDICEEALSWSGLCSAGPIYVIFQNDANWSTTGNFANNPSAASPIRHYRSAITTTSGSTFTINYTTDGNQYPDNDGVYATFDANGGPATTYGDNNCILDPVLLPSDLVNFNGQIVNSQSLLTWETSSEQNNDFFTISHSTTGYDFEVIGQVQGAGNSSTFINYNLIHDRPSPGINYYKLTSTDFDGTTYVKGIVSLLFNSNGCYFDAQTSEIKFNERSDYRVFSMDGKLLGEAMNETSLQFNQQGIVIIQDLRTGLTERLFVP